MAIPYATKNELNNLSNRTLKCKRNIQSGNVPVICDGKTKVENIYFDTSKSVEEVNEILSKLTYGDDNDFHSCFYSLNKDGTSGYGITIFKIPTNNNEKTSIIYLQGVGLEKSFPKLPEIMPEFKPNTFYEIPIYATYSLGEGVPAGWLFWNLGATDTIVKVIINDISKDVYDGGRFTCPVGLENDKLSSFMYSEKLEPREVETGVLLDNNNNKFYPKTIISRVKDEDSQWIPPKINIENTVSLKELDMTYIENQTSIPDDLYNSLISETENHYINIMQNEAPISLYIEMSSSNGLLAQSYVQGNVWELTINEMKEPSLTIEDVILVEEPKEVGEYDIRITKIGESISAPRFNKLV